VPSVQRGCFPQDCGCLEEPHVAGEHLVKIPAIRQVLQCMEIAHDRRRRHQCERRRRPHCQPQRHDTPGHTNQDGDDHSDDNRLEREQPCSSVLHIYRRRNRIPFAAAARQRRGRRQPVEQAENNVRDQHRDQDRLQVAAAHSGAEGSYHTLSVRARTGPSAVTSRYVVAVNAAATTLSIVLAAGIGGALGSYAGVVSQRGWRGSLEGRSHCESCGRTLRWFELVPLVSYPLLRRRCRTCGARVPISVYAWELGGALLAVAALIVVLVVARSP